MTFSIHWSDDNGTMHSLDWSWGKRMWSASEKAEGEARWETRPITDTDTARLLDTFHLLPYQSEQELLAALFASPKELQDLCWEKERALGQPRSMEIISATLGEHRPASAYA